MASLTRAIVEFLRDSIEGDHDDPPPPLLIAAVENIKNRLTGIDIDPDHNGLADWLDALDELRDVKLRDTILVRALQVRAPRIAEALTFVGLVKIDFQNGKVFSFRIDWDLIDRFIRTPGEQFMRTLSERVQDRNDVKALQVLTGLLLAAPRELLKLEYQDQGYAALSGALTPTSVDLVALVNELIRSPLRIRLPIAPPLMLPDFKRAANPDPALPGSNYLALLESSPLPSPPLDGLGFELKLDDTAGFFSNRLDLGSGFQLRASSPDSGQQTFRIAVKNGKVDPSTASTGTVEIAVEYDPAGNAITLGSPTETRLEIGPIRLSLRVQPRGPASEPGRPLFRIRAVAERLTLVVSTEAFGLLSKAVALPREIRLQVDADMAYVQGKGLQTAAGAGMPALSTVFTVPLDLRVGDAAAGLTIDRAVVKIEVKRSGEKIEAKVSVRVGAKGALGPVTIIADGIGAWFGNPGGHPASRAEPPNLLGLSLDAGPISGGGTLAKVDSDYAGSLQLKLMGIGVNAFALLGEVDGASSFVGILGIRLSPPGVQIGFGFAIMGIGGLVGINRRVDTDVLREQIASGTASDILFCDDPVRNAVTIVGQAGRLFPSEKGIFLVGPTFRLTWLGLLNIDAGLFVELPGPRQIFVAGTARLVIGPESAALIYLRLDFAGGVDLPKSLIWFDALLVKSHVMQVFHVTGGVALRIAYGDNGFFLLTVGGFHPSFNPGGIELPRLARVGTATSIAIAWFKLECYVALTSTTFQIGAAVEAGLKLGPISAHGWLKFDALVQYHPFYFVAAIDAGFDVELFGESFCGVRLQGRLSGPGPLVVEARASVKLLFVRVSERVTVTLGSDAREQPVAVVDLQAALAAEFGKAANLRSEGDDRSVVLRDGAMAAVGNAPVVGIVGDIVWEQKRAPFGLDLQRFEGAPLPPGRHVLGLSSPDADLLVEMDWFGTGSFLKLSDAEALNNVRFTQAQSGARIKLEKIVTGNSAPCTAKLNLVKLPHRILIPPFAISNYVNRSLARLLAEEMGQAKLEPGDALIKVVPEAWKVRAADGAIAANGIGGTQAFAFARSLGGTATPASAAAVDLSGAF